MSAATRHRFDDFLLDTGNRSLLRDGQPVPLNARYFDALALLVREHGRLVGKRRLFDEVWAGSVVTDAALTQCITAIRRALGDEAAKPRFVRTVAGHGYSFIAPVQADVVPDAPRPGSASAGFGATAVRSPSPPHDSPEDAAAGSPAASRTAAPATALPRWLIDGAAATLGGGAAGLLGGLLYGSALAVAAPAQGVGSLSVLLVLIALSVLVGLAGAFGVGFGMAIGQRLASGPVPRLAGAALGGLAVGGLANLLGSDAFTLLVGAAPAGLTGGLEGAAIGLAVAAGLLLGGGADARNPWHPVAGTAASTGVAGALVALAGGSLMATSLARIAVAFDASRLDLSPLGRLFGEPQFGPLVQAALGATEGAIFGGCVSGALALVRRRLG